MALFVASKSFKSTLATRSTNLLQPLALRFYATKPDVSFNELQKLIHGVAPQKYVLIDVREPNEVAQGKIPTAVHVPLGEVAQAFQLNSTDFKAKYGIPKPTSDIETVFYCRSGKRSSSAIEAVEKLGQDLTLRNFRGSWLEYSANALKDQTLV
ncbi:hypothetical protein H4219_003864 [Mycoemilia scoparia]|uniref:Rhodanese domain-containing protein n=1 Tax=Mycoemilia scoparia TaxID=417184 RepID=A0A9W8DS20_9FUNG|nr:hypothetical protein H4219_003864 [Mycoemilia scoparia]